MSAPDAQAQPKPAAPPPAPPSEKDVWGNAQKAIDDRQKLRRTMASSYLAGAPTPNNPTQGATYLG